MDLIEDQPCPSCGDHYGVRWMDGTPTSDTWNCRWCGHDWLIAVDEPARHPEALPSRVAGR
jgi:hypothetical protein